MTIESILNAQRTAQNGDATGRAIHSCTPDEPLRSVVERLTQARIGAMPVLEPAADGEGAPRIVGIVSERDIIHCLASQGGAALDSTVAAAMTSPAITIERSTHALAALLMMTRRRIRHLPVVEDGRMIGFVSIGDLVKHRIERIEAEAEALRDYIAR